IMPAGSDIMTGELVLRRWQPISPREVGVLAAVGLDKVKVYRKPRVAIISTGNELVQPGRTLQYAQVYDINSGSIATSIIENGGISLKPIIVRDDRASIKKALTSALQEADIILTSGSTSVGAGDILYRVIDELGPPGIIAHGLTVKPGKPTILAVTRGRPLIGLPGYPTSALMIFHLIVAPIIRRMAGLPESGEAPLIDAKVAVKIFSAKGRRELLPIQLISSKEGFSVYPIGLGSGAISSMALADGYIDIPKNQEYLEEDEDVKVRLFSSELHPADLIIIGSHCTGIDLLLQHMRNHTPSLTFKVVNTGSLGGFKSVERGEADIAGVHLLDEDTGEYNTSFLQRFNLTGRARLIRGYRREQGLIVAKGNPKGIRGLEDILRRDVTFINRNRGSGTRVLTDIRLKSMAEERGVPFEELKKGVTGYDVEAKSHSAVAAAVAQGRADAGLGIKTVAHFYNLDFIQIVDERYDFLTPAGRADKEAVKLLFDTLRSREFQKDLQKKMPGLKATSETGMVLVDTDQNR
ncbi:MAG: molybdopterin biosynthesis protein, partial [Nitrososphaerales archaeon]